MRPNVGRSPVTPHLPEGLRIDPLVSVPMANATHPAAVADPGPAPLAGVRERFVQDGIFAVDLGADAAAEIRAGLTFAPDPDGVHVRPDWAGEPLGGSRFVAAARPGEALLQRCAAIFSADAVRDALASTVGADFGMNVRFLRALAPADPALGQPPHFAETEVPPGFLRAILYLNAAGPGGEPQTFAGRGGAVAKLQPAAGQVIVYDPARLTHRESDPGRETLDAILVPVPAGRPCRIVSAGANHWWPLDPAALAHDGLVIADLVR